MPLTSEILLETAYLCVLWGALGAAVGLLCRQGIEAFTAYRRRLPLRPPTPLEPEEAPALAAPAPAPAELTATVPALAAVEPRGQQQSQTQAAS